MKQHTTDILTAAANPSVKRPTKYTARKLILAIIDQERAPTTEEWTSLYTFFTDRKAPAKPKSAEQWVARHRASQDVRTYLNYLYSDGVNLVATDGHRMALVETTLDKGYYDDDLNPIDVSYTYVNFNRVIPTGLDGVFYITAEGIMSLPRKPYRNTKAEQVELIPGRWFQLNYVKDAIALAGKGMIEIRYDADEGREKSTIKINFPDRRREAEATAVLMPLI